MLEVAQILWVIPLFRILILAVLSTYHPMIFSFLQGERKVVPVLN